MSERPVQLNLAGEHKLARDLVAGGVFVPGYVMPLNEDCELILRGAGDTELRLLAKVVWTGNGGIGLQLLDCNGEMKQRIAALANAADTSRAAIDVDALAAATDTRPTEVATTATTDPPPADAADPPPADAGIEQVETVPEGASDDADLREPSSASENRPLHERLRNLPLAQQLKIAAHGELGERIMLERIYGKNVWEALLRNSRLTGPEVARIARMGSLPRPLMEIILNNGGWLQIGEVRRALLTNPRLGTDQILRILRLLPKHEIKVAAMQTIYPVAVRDAAKRLLKEMG